MPNTILLLTVQASYKAPFPVALQLAKLCCRQFTEQVLGYIQGEEAALRKAIVTRHYRSSQEEDREYDVDPRKTEKYLDKQLPIFEVVREWCGGQVAVGEFDQMLALKSEVERLRKLVEETANWLRESGHRVKAALLLKELNRSDGTSGP